MKIKGFSIIELMISILIASIVTVGLTGVLTSSVLSFGFSNASNNAITSAHRVNVSLNTFLFQAGFINYRRSLTYFEFPKNDSNFGPDAMDWYKNVVVIGGASDEGHGDAIKVRFWGASIDDDRSVANQGYSAFPNGYIYDCFGRAIDNGVMLEVRLRVDADRGLICSQRYLYNLNGSDEQTDDVVIDPTVRFIRFQYANTGFQNGFGRYENFLTKKHSVGKSYAVNSETLIANEHIDTIRYAFVTSQPTQQKAIKSTQTLTLFPECTISADSNQLCSYKIPENDSSNVHRVVLGTVSLNNAI